MSPDGSRVYVADLGIDKVMIYRIVNGRLEANQPDHVAVHSGAGPRHFDFHPNGRFAYIINELDLTVTVCAFDAGTGALNPIQTHTTLPKDVVDRSGYSWRRHSCFPGWPLRLRIEPGPPHHRHILR